MKITLEFDNQKIEFEDIKNDKYLFLAMTKNNNEEPTIRTVYNGSQMDIAVMIVDLLDTLLENTQDEIFINSIWQTFKGLRTIEKENNE